MQNRRPGIHPGIIDVYLAVREADRGLAECEDILRGQMRLAGLSEDEIEAQMRATRPRAPEVPPLLAALGLLLARAALLVAPNVVGFIALLLLLTALMRG